MRYKRRVESVDAILFDGTVKSAEKIKELLGEDTKVAFPKIQDCPNVRWEKYLVVRGPKLQGLVDKDEFVVLHGDGSVTVEKKAIFLKNFETDERYETLRLWADCESKGVTEDGAI